MKLIFRIIFYTWLVIYQTFKLAYYRMQADLLPSFICKTAFVIFFNTHRNLLMLFIKIHRVNLTLPTNHDWLIDFLTVLKSKTSYKNWSFPNIRNNFEMGWKSLAEYLFKLNCMTVSEYMENTCDCKLEVCVSDNWFADWTKIDLVNMSFWKSHAESCKNLFFLSEC